MSGNGSDDEMSEATANQLSVLIANNLASTRQHHIPTFSGKKTEDPIKFIRVFKRAAKALKWDDAMQVNKFCNYLTDSAENWYFVNVESADVQPANFEALQELFEKHFLRGDYKSHLTRELRKRQLKPDESILSYLTDIQALCIDLDSDMSEHQVIEYAYAGLPDDLAAEIAYFDPETVEELLKVAKRVERGNDFLKSKRDKARRVHLVSKQSEPEQGKDEMEEMIAKIVASAVSQMKGSKNSELKAAKLTRDASEGSKGNWFKKPFDKNRSSKEIQCFYCKKFGHIKADCYKLKKVREHGGKQINVIQQQQADQEALDKHQREVNLILHVPKDKKNMIYIDVFVNDKRIKGIVDSGAEISIIKKKVADELKLPIKPYLGPSVLSVSGDHLSLYGYVEVEIGLELKFNLKKVMRISLLVVNDLPADVLLGNDFNTPMKLKINCENRSVEWDGQVRDAPSSETVDVSENVPLVKDKRLEMSLRLVHAAEDVLLNRRSVNCVKVDIPRDGVKKDDNLMISCSDKVYERTKVSLQNSVFKGIPENCLIANLKNFDVKVKKGTVLGSCCVVATSEVNAIALDNDECQADCKNRESNLQCLTCLQEEIFNDDDNETTYKTMKLEKGEVRVGSQLKDNQLQALKQLLSSYPDLIIFNNEKIGEIKDYVHRVPLVKDARPIKQSPARCSFKEMKVIDEEIKRLQDQGVVKPGSGPFASRTVLVYKRDSKPRLCVDYRALNKITIHDSYPIGDIRMCLKALTNNKYFTALDSNSAFYQIKIHEDDVDKTGFVSPSGQLYNFLRLPFGMSNSSASFCRALDITLSGLKYNHVVTFVDDIVVMGKSFNEHQCRLETVLTRLNDSGFTLKAEKCSFAFDKIVFLSHCIDENGLRPAKRLIRAITEFPIPDEQKAVRSFLGLTGFFRKFVEKYSVLVKPLIELTKENIEFKWNSAADEAFVKLKQLLIEQPILCHYDPDKITLLYTDASLKGISGCLLQLQAEGKKPVGYFSRVLKGSEVNYAIYDLEALAAVEAMRHFRDMLYGIKFTLITDNLAVSYIMNQKEINGRLARVRMEMQDYEFDIKHKPGEKNKAADALSRYPIGMRIVSTDDKIHDGIKVFNSALDEKNTKLKLEQRKDKAFGKIIKVLENQSKSYNKLMKKYAIIGGVLYKSVFDGHDWYYVICLPKSFRRVVMFELHDSLVAGHFGTKKTLALVRQKYYFPRMAQYVKDYVKTCLKCQLRKTEKKKQFGMLQSIPANHKFEIIGLDFLEIQTKSKTGCLHVLVATCQFTKFAIAKAVRKNDSKTVAKFLFYNIICIFGFPKKILSDRAMAFLSKMMKDIYSLMGIKHLKTSGYHSQCNAVAERFNQTLQIAISMYVNDKHTDWCQIIEPLCFAYNQTVNNTTGYTPYEMMFGEKCNLLSSIKIPTDKEMPNPNAYVKYLKDKLSEINKRVLPRLVDSNRKNAKYYDKNRREDDFQVGDLVLMKRLGTDPDRTNKFLMKFVGPFKVVKKISPVLLQLDFKPTRNSTNIVHVEKLKRFYDREELLSRDSDNSETSKDSGCSDSESVVSESPKPKQRLRRAKREKSKMLTKEVDSTVYSTCESDGVQEADDGPNYNVDEFGRRRAGRPHRPVERMGLLNWVLFSMLLLSFSQASVESLSITEPLIWYKINDPVIEGVESVTTVIKYKTPCDLFDKILIDKDSTEELKTWCQHEFKNNFLMPLNGFCQSVGSRDSAKFSLARDKRFVISGTIVVFTLISIVASVGISSWALIESRQQSDEINTLSDEMEKAIRNINRMTADERLERDVLETFNLALQNLTSEFLDMVKQVNNIKESVPRAMRVVAYLTTRFQHIKDVLVDTANDFAEGKLNSKFLSIFNVSMPCNSECPPRLWSAQSCVYDEMRNMIILKHDMKLVNRQMQVLRADAFDLVKSVKLYNKVKICHSRYTGPKTVIFDTKTSCVVPVRNEIISDSNLVIGPIGIKCLENNKLEYSKSTFWDKGVCEMRDSLETSDVVQVKQSMRINYIYCNGLNISIFNRTIPCPGEVFALPSNVSFKINELVYNNYQSVLHKDFQFIPEWTYQINHHLDPLMRENLETGYFKKLNHELQRLAEEEPDLINDVPNHIPMASVAVILCCAIGMGMFMLWNKLQNRSNVNPTLEYHSTGEIEEDVEGQSGSKPKSRILISMK